MVTRSFDARDRLGCQLFGPIGLYLVDTHHKEDQAWAKQAVVTGMPGPFHRGLAVSKAAVRRSGEVEDAAQDRGRMDEQTILPKLFGDRHGFFAKVQRQLHVDPAGDHGCARQRGGSQRGISARFGSLQYRNDHAKRPFPLRVVHPVADKRRCEPQDLFGSLRHVGGGDACSTARQMLPCSACSLRIHHTCSGPTNSALAASATERK